MDFVHTGSHNLWVTERTNDWQMDFDLGRKFANQYIAVLKANRCSPYFLSEIIKQWDGVGTIEHGFLTELSSNLL